MLTVVVADGHADTRATFGLLLKEFGYRAVEAADGAKALEYSLSAQASALLVDQDLPMEDLAAIAAEIRAERGREILLVLMTAWNEKSHPRPAGFDLCLVKPFHTADLIGLLRTHERRLQAILKQLVDRQDNLR